jgi:FkbM family methyltransferase
MSTLSVLRFIANHPLNSGKKMSALVRFAKWQIGSRLVPGAVSFEWVCGTRLLVRPGETGLTGNIYTGLHEYHDMAFVLHSLRKDDIFIDVGANLGSYTILACAAIGAQGHAFEPVRSNFEKLVQNVRLNGIETAVRCHNVGVGRERGTLLFTSAFDTTNHVIAEGENCEAVESVPVVTLDEALLDQSPTLIKIDAEGYEMPVLEGGEETLKKATLNALIVELNGSGLRYGFDDSKILGKLLDHGFGTYAYDPVARTLTSLHEKNNASGNTLFIRNVPLVTERLRTASKVCVNGQLI